MGFVGKARKLCRRYRHWKPIVYILTGILVLQVLITLNSTPNLIEEEIVKYRRQARLDQHNALAKRMLQGEKSVLAKKYSNNLETGMDVELRQPLIVAGGSDLFVLEDHHNSKIQPKGPNGMKKDDSDIVLLENGESNKVHVRTTHPKPYSPKCKVEHKDANSAISRAKTDACKQEIADVACSSQNGTLFPESIPRYCPHQYKYGGQAPVPPANDKIATPVKICFILIVHGRAIRQLNRMFKSIYHEDHYFYFHVDKRSDYMYRKVLELSAPFPNVKVAPWRLATIWGGSSLLQMLMHALSDVLKLWKDWDFMINLSALDFPIETNDKLVRYLSAYKDKNFMKSHGRDDEKFIRKQGLNKIFVECEQHMWRLGERDLPKGITLNGGSDWVALNRDYCDYIINGEDQLLKELKHWYKYTLLPAESFFHTLAQNSLKCESFIDNNLRVTNWNRARGCKCQYKHIVDWCGCSPNDFYPQDLTRLQTSRPVFFARKFEECINQEVVNHLDFKLYGDYPSGTPSIHSYWENVFDWEDVIQPSDTLLTHYHSFARIGLKKLLPTSNDESANSDCVLEFVKLKTVEMYRHKEEFKGYVVTFEAQWMMEDVKYRRMQAKHNTVSIQTLVSHKLPLQIHNAESALASRLEWAGVGTNWDVKELVLRDWGGIMGPLSELRLVAKWLNSKEDFIVTLVVIDPLNVVADYSDFRAPSKSAGITDTPLNLKKPLRPGKWKVRFYTQRQFQKAAAELTFVVAPLQFRQSRVGDVSLVTDNRGVTDDADLNSAKRNLYSISNALSLHRDYGAEESLAERAAYVGEDLTAWIDEVVEQVWVAEDLCLAESDLVVWSRSLPKDVGWRLKQEQSPKICKSTHWSSLSPDPKSEIGPLQPNGRIR